MDAAPAPRVGIVRADRPSAVVAEAEARVLAAELERRLGPVVLDLRLADPAATSVGPWQPLAHAAWPGDIDARIDIGRLDHLAPLGALFARTVEPVAAEVRRRMLAHLGLLPRDVVDDALLDELGRTTLRPTDVWLLITEADAVDVADPAIGAMATPTGHPSVDDLDAAFDAVADDLAAVSSVARSVSWERRRVQAVADLWRERAAALERQLTRSEREASERCDALAAEVDVLRARLAAAEAGGALGSNGGS